MTTESLDILKESGKATGKFQKYLNGFPAEELYEIIPKFHYTPNRVNQLNEALSNKENLSKVYDGNRVNNPNFDREGDGDITFEWDNIKGEETIKLENAPKNAGTYKVIINSN